MDQSVELLSGSLPVQAGIIVAVMGTFVAALIKIMGEFRKNLNQVSDDCHNRHEALTKAHEASTEQLVLHFKESLSLVTNHLGEKIDSLTRAVEGSPGRRSD